MIAEFSWIISVFSIGNAIAILFTVRRYASAVYAVEVCLFVRHTLVLYTKTAKQRIMQTRPYDSPGSDSSFLMRKISAKLHGVTPNRDAK